MPAPDLDDAPVVVARARGHAGELVLRRQGEHVELVEDGVFLMDTRDGRSERLLATAALAAVERPRRVLVGGLGMGTTLLAVLADPRAAGVERVDVVEREPVVVGWHRTHLADRTGAALADPRTHVVVADVVEHVRTAAAGSYDVVLLDVDNGPDWLATPGNARLYDDDGLDALVRLLAPGGTLAVWSADPAPALAAALRCRFADVRDETAPSRVAGRPDHVLLARTR